jgi:succinyl-diaminopimelate desuccinylase
MLKRVAKPVSTSYYVANNLDVVALATALMRCPSVTPHTAGVFDVIEEFLVPLGFRAMRHTFHEEGAEPVENIYLRYGDTSPNFCFAGHTDVVPPGDVSAWSVPPFEPRVVNGELVGRGAEDMKGAIAAFMIAARNFMQAQPEPKGSISLLITQDEEGIAVNGTKKMLHWLQEKGETLDMCLVGEPTNPEQLSDMMKIGRRGSVTFTITVRGKQGHVAYPERADNPITRLIALLHTLKSTPLDSGSEHFPPSNLEITSVDVGNPTANVIPALASAKLNVRFNDQHSGASVQEWVQRHCANIAGVEIESRISGESFLTRNEALIHVVRDAVHDVTGRMPLLTTTGGTSDARFIKDFCPVVEFGTTGRYAHMVDERVEVKTLEGLVAIYQRVLENVFSNTPRA